jgi:hypothetical protein
LLGQFELDSNRNSRHGKVEMKPSYNHEMVFALANSMTNFQIKGQQNVERLGNRLLTNIDESQEVEPAGNSGDNP